ncbi:MULTISPECIES: cysteine hydrolase family protein [Pseudofrankia]|uniref:cysteine hydrolase family protein n=1 Tax=Pseudofrankia TaxID=2994363 RepID=UPI000234B967|nr:MULTISPECIES: cysteine hydrolase family protein [Pseudofrankia]OHV40540.1 isochorismatase [Pseudofrankia sp. EUN1h]
MSNRALIVIDVQREYDTGTLPITYPPLAGSLDRIGQAMDVARDRGIPVVVIQQDADAGLPAFAGCSSGWELHPVVAARPRDVLLRKRLPGSFTGTGLEGWLRERAVDTVTLVGYMTHHCVDTTARQASHAGFAVEVLSDATGTLAYANEVGALTAEQMHARALTVLHAGFAAVGTTDAWLAALAAGTRLPGSSAFASGRVPAATLG